MHKETKLKVTGGDTSPQKVHYTILKGTLRATVRERAKQLNGSGSSLRKIEKIFKDEGMPISKDSINRLIKQ